MDGLKQQQLGLIEREEVFSKKILEIEQTKRAVEQLKQRNEQEMARLEALTAEQVTRLEAIAHLTREEAV